MEICQERACNTSGVPSSLPSSVQCMPCMHQAWHPRRYTSWTFITGAPFRKEVARPPPEGGGPAYGRSPHGLSSGRAIANHQRPTLTPVGFEPGTSRTRSENHTTTPKAIGSSALQETKTVEPSPLTIA